MTRAGAVIAVQTFGDFQNFNPYLHVISTDGCFSGNGIFRVSQCPNLKDFEDLFVTQPKQLQPDYVSSSLFISDPV